MALALAFPVGHEVKAAMMRAGADGSSCHGRQPVPVLTHVRVIVGSLLLTPLSAGAGPRYDLQVMARVGDRAGGITVAGRLLPAALTDDGRLLFATERPDQNQALFAYADGQIAPIVALGFEAPGGHWRSVLRVAQPTGMNQRGSVALTIGQLGTGPSGWLGSFRWDAASGSLVTVARTQMPAVHDLTFLLGDQATTPTINNRDEIAFAGTVRDALGRPRRAFFFMGVDGLLRPVALPDQEAHGGEIIQPAGSISLTDQGVVVFQAYRQGDPPNALSAYAWENGSLTSLVRVGDPAPGGVVVTRVTGVRANNRSRVVLVAAHVDAHADRAGLFFALHGQLRPIALPGQEMPGGGRLRTLRESMGSAGPSATFHLSRASEVGEYAFVGVLEDDSQAIYRVAEAGALSLVLKTGTTTPLGRIAGINRDGYGLGLNSRGQVAVTVQPAGQPDALVLLTPGTEQE